MTDRRSLPALLAVAALFALAQAAHARDSLGVFDDWGAFRDPAAAETPLRCYAIAEPASGGAMIRYVTIGYWPDSRVRGQFHARLARPMGGAASISIGGRRFALIAGGTSLWASDARMDAAIIAAMRSARTMTVSVGGTSATWRLRGAATAIDAAALGCARRG